MPGALSLFLCRTETPSDDDPDTLRSVKVKGRESCSCGSTPVNGYLTVLQYTQPFLVTLHFLQQSEERFS